MDPVRVDVRLSNNRMKERRVALGMTVRQLAERAGVSVAAIVSYHRFGRSPRNAKSGNWTSTALALAAALETTPEELWPKTVQAIGVSSFTTTMTEGALEKYYLEASQQCADRLDLEARIEDREKLQLAQHAISCLPERYQRILSRSVAGDTLDEIGAQEGITRERVRQLLKKTRFRIVRDVNAVTGEIVEEPEEAEEIDDEIMQRTVEFFSCPLVLADERSVLVSIPEAGDYRIPFQAIHSSSIVENGVYSKLVVFWWFASVVGLVSEEI